MTDITVTYARDLTWSSIGPVDEDGKGIFVSLMHGELESRAPTAFLMKYSAGVRAPAHTHSGDYHCVVVSGQFRHFASDEDEFEILGPGSTWFQKGGAVHQDVCVGPEDGVLSIFWPDGFDVDFVSAQPD
jgi:quercetin dioxygenase-like cupin family protein